MIKYAIAALLFLFSIGLSHAQETATGAAPVKWMTFEDAVKRNAVEKREIFIDVYTDWCGWCKVMDRETFTEPMVAKLLNEKFYPVKLNAEQTEDIQFNGNTFKFVPYGNKGSHQLAMALLNNQMSYPTVVFLDGDYAGAYPIPGYRKPAEFHKFLVYFGEGQHRKGVKFETFESQYKSPYPAEANANGASQKR